MRTNLITDIFIRGFGVLRLLITPFILNTNEYGELGLISAIFLYANFADLGLQVHYEVISSMAPEEIKSELKIIFRKLIPRLLISGFILSFIIFIKFHLWHLVFWSFIFVFTLNIDTLFQIILRQQKIYDRLALSLFLQALLLTAFIGPAAWWMKVSGVIALQAIVPLISIIINAAAVWGLIKEKKIKEIEEINQSLWTEKTTFWLFLGQIQMMIWITIDRFFLSKNIPAHEFGLWNLGNMAGSVLLGFANTWGTLKIPLWKKENHSFFDLKFTLSFLGIYCLGILGLYLATHFILKEYIDGLNWNITWLSITFFISFIFISDAHARAQMKNTSDAKRWCSQKFIAQSMGAITLWILFINGTSPRSSLCIGIMVSCLFVYGFTFSRIKKYV